MICEKCWNDKFRIADKIRKGDQTPPCYVCRKPFKWENHFNVAIWDANEWEIETFWVHIECNAHTIYADHVKELGKVRVTYKDGKGKFEILKGE